VSDSRLVYSTDRGDQRRRGESHDGPAAVDATGPVRVWREKGGRRGKTVTVVRGLPGADLDAVAGDLKKHCGAGGAVKEGAVEIQGDHRAKVVARLQAKGYAAKAAGG
jgi:translation initiation factor 1